MSNLAQHGTHTVNEPADHGLTASGALHSPPDASETLWRTLPLVLREGAPNSQLLAWLNCFAAHYPLDASAQIDRLPLRANRPRLLPLG